MIECWTGRQRRKDAQGEAMLGPVVVFKPGNIPLIAEKHAKCSGHQATLQRLAVVAIVSDHVAEQAQHGVRIGGCG